MKDWLDLPAPTLIAEGSALRGEVVLQSGANVCGLVEGEIHHQSADTLLVGAKGWVNGKIRAQGPVCIEGRLQGHVRSETLIRLLPTAIVQAVLEAPRIEILAGAEFVGETRMDAAEVTHELQPKEKAA